MQEERNKESGLIDKVAESFAEVDLGGNRNTDHNRIPAAEGLSG